VSYTRVGPKDTGAQRGGPLTMLQTRSMVAPWWGRTIATSVSGGLSAVASSILISSKSLFTFAIEAQGSAGPAWMPYWSVATLGETASGSHVRFATVGSFGVGSYAAGSAGLGWSATVMWSLSNPRRGRAQ